MRFIAPRLERRHVKHGDGKAVSDYAFEGSGAIFALGVKQRKAGSGNRLRLRSRWPSPADPTVPQKVIDSILYLCFRNFTESFFTPPVVRVLYV